MPQIGGRAIKNEINPVYAYIIIAILVIGAVAFGYTKLSHKPVGRFDEMSDADKKAFEKMYGPTGTAANRGQTPVQDQTQTR